MNKSILLRAAAFAGLALSAAFGDQSTSILNQSYASDKFDGFESFDADNRIKQKTKSFWYSVSKETAEDQLNYARQKEAAGSFNRARKAYEALIREWPTSPQAAQAQFCLAQLFENNERYEKAFEEYQYLLSFYAGHCPYNEILDRQFRIANHLLHHNNSMFGLSLSGMDPIRERFEQIVRNAPRSAIAPEAMLIIGSIRVSEKEIEEAIAAFDRLLNRFPTSPQALSAQYLAAQCRHEVAVKHSYNESRCRDAVAFLKSVLTRVPNHPQKEQMTAWLKELEALLVEQNYQKAVFYDSKRWSAEAAKTAYRSFLKDFPDSKYAPRVRERLSVLERAAPAAK